MVTSAKFREASSSYEVKINDGGLIMNNIGHMIKTRRPHKNN